MILDLLFQLHFSLCTLNEDMWQCFRPSQEERSIQLDAEDSDNGDSDNSQAVFTCPQVVCTITYIKLSALGKHIESGKHKFYQEKEVY